MLLDNTSSLRIILLIVQLVSPHQFDPIQNEIQTSLADCTLALAETNFAVGSTIAIITANEYSKNEITGDLGNIIVRYIMHRQRWTVKTTLEPPTINRLEVSLDGKIKSFILTIKTEEDCVSILNQLVEAPTWDPHGKILIVVPWSQNDWKSIVSFIFQQFSKHFVINIALAVQVNQSSSNLSVKIL